MNNNACFECVYKHLVKARVYIESNTLEPAEYKAAAVGNICIAADLVKPKYARLSAILEAIADMYMAYAPNTVVIPWDDILEFIVAVITTQDGDKIPEIPSKLLNIPGILVAY